MFKININKRAAWLWLGTAVTAGTIAVAQTAARASQSGGGGGGSILCYVSDHQVNLGNGSYYEFGPYGSSTDYKGPYIGYAGYNYNFVNTTNSSVSVWLGNDGADSHTAYCDGVISAGTTSGE
jgi:hypothetical protein